MVKCAGDPDIRERIVDERKAFGRRLRAARKVRGLTLAAVAEFVGVSDEALRAWEQGHRRPATERLEELSRALGLTPEWLLAGDRGEEDVLGSLTPAIAPAKFLSRATADECAARRRGLAEAADVARAAAQARREAGDAARREWAMRPRCITCGTTHGIAFGFCAAHWNT